jgi:hypothetical protein
MSPLLLLLLLIWGMVIIKGRRGPSDGRSSVYGADSSLGIRSRLRIWAKGRKARSRDTIAGCVISA